MANSDSTSTVSAFGNTLRVTEDELLATITADFCRDVERARAGEKQMGVFGPSVLDPAILYHVGDCTYLKVA